MMRLLFAAAVGGLMVVATLSTPASAWQCMARSTNGAVGLGSGIILERAQKFAIRRCIAAGGNVSGYACSIRYCR
jgi:hypothetical protein